jgi:hypothetical protein
MDEASLEKAITKMERELRSLKTSHRIGAGTIRFYDKTGTIHGGSGSRIRIKIADDEPLPTFLTVILPTGQVVTPSVNETTRIATVYYGTSVSGTVVAVSSSLMEYMETA